MASEVLSPAVKTEELYLGLNAEEQKLLRGGILDMWRLYQKLSSEPERLSHLTFFDALSARNGMIFPDFFNAINRFLYPEHFSSPRVNKKPLETLKAELNQTFQAMDSKWDSYGPFFERHPELRYLGELSCNNYLEEFSEIFPFLRGINTNMLWSILEYHRLGGNLDFYVALDEAICQNPDVGILFEKDTENYPGEFMVYLHPYGKAADQIKEYLPQLKHGDLIGFGTIGLVEVNGEKFVAVSSLQTDLLRKDHIATRDFPWITFSQCDTKRNSDGKHTVPCKIRRHYLANDDWAHRLVSAVEGAALQISDQVPVSGVIIPTLTTYGAYSFAWVSKSEYARRLYSSFPQERGYHLDKFRPVFPLTERWGGIMWSGSGEWWVKPIDELQESGSQSCSF